MSDVQSVVGLSEAQIVAATEQWLERAVIGLNLCPFARAAKTSQRIRYRVSQARSVEQLRTDLVEELQRLAAEDPTTTETTLLVHPWVLVDFLDYNDFLDVADQTLEELDLEGVIQIASFHPHYQFADIEADAIENYTNRAPYPTLHLLREDSLERGLANFPDPDSIYLRNIETLRALGLVGWKRLWRDA